MDNTFKTIHLKPFFFSYLSNNLPVTHPVPLSLRHTGLVLLHLEAHFVAVIFLKNVKQIKKTLTCSLNPVNLVE